MSPKPGAGIWLAIAAYVVTKGLLVFFVLLLVLPSRGKFGEGCGVAGDCAKESNSSPEWSDGGVDDAPPITPPPSR